MSHERWPGWVYRTGEEPDYRFSFANERTFLAWIRTSLAFLAAAVAIDVVDLDVSDAIRRATAGLMVLLALSSSVMAWWRWAAAERAVRRREALPAFGFGVVIALGMVGAAVLVVLASL
ncbi:DUF202 domain-containing protein [Nocardioides ginsengisoli]|uniref:YidH family protein n=1 Tax=Nocardioides ginsengisoli TaxID=363868 RepID=A0ABW3VUH2_9ACTN